MKQIITHFTDNDLYTFTCQYYILQTYPRAEVRYTFFDRNKSIYPQGFAELLQEQINGMKDVIITEEEINFMKDTIYFLPVWYYNFLRGYRFNPKEVTIEQDEEGHLSIGIEGPWYSTIMWEMPILSTISELLHIVKGDLEKIDMRTVYLDAFEKGAEGFGYGLKISDMGTRRRTSFDVQKEVIKALIEADKHNLNPSGKFTGTSNVWFAKEFGINCIGTLSHQIISAEECVSGVFECNHNVMKKWSHVYNGDLGTYLYDCFGDDVFFSNFSKDMAKMFDGLRVDSGNEMEQLQKIMKRYRELGIDPKTKTIIFSNALTISKAISLHQHVNGQMKDSYGIGTHLCADVTDKTTGQKFPYSNIVIKLTGFRITESREWQPCVKLSIDKGKVLGDKDKCDYLKKILNF